MLSLLSVGHCPIRVKSGALGTDKCSRMCLSCPVTPPTADPETPAVGVRNRARDEMRRLILDAGRARLAADGPAALSLRAVARDVGLVSSAVYRYVPSRDALLTALIIESYDALGEAAESAEGAVERPDVVGRYTALWRAVRRWGLEHPHEWALVFGSPIPGYAAPEDTIGSASRIPALLVALLRDAGADGVPLPEEPVEPAVLAAMGPVVDFFADACPPETAVRALMAWTALLGSVSLQVFGHRHNVIADEGGADFFDGEVRRTAAFVGLSAGSGRQDQ